MRDKWHTNNIACFVVELVELALELVAELVVIYTELVELVTIQNLTYNKFVIELHKFYKFYAKCNEFLDKF